MGLVSNKPTVQVVFLFYYVSISGYISAVMQYQLNSTADRNCLLPITLTLIGGSSRAATYGVPLTVTATPA
jgi:hypothetical protein